MHKLLLAVLTLASAACAHLTPPERGGSPWFRLTSEHFTLLTDLPEARVEPALRELEERRSGLLDAVWEGMGDPPGRTEVILFRRAGDFAEFGRSSEGWRLEGFPAGGPLGERAMVLHAEEPEQRLRSLQFLLAVDLTLATLPHFPSWLPAGLGRYLETARVDASRGRFVVGEPTRDLLLGAGAPRPSLWVNGAPTVPFQPSTEAWETVHYLYTERGPAFAALLARLHEGQAPDASWSAAFGGLSDRALAVAVRDYSRTILHSGRVQVATFPLRRWTGLVTTEKLSPAETHALFARLYVYGFDGQHSAALRGRAAHEVAEALRLDADEPGALLLGPLATLPPDQRRARLEALTRTRGEDFRAWYLLGTEASLEAPARLRALRTALERAPGHPRVLVALSETVRPQDPAEARALAERAVRAAPSMVEARLAVLAALEQAGLCDEVSGARARLEGWASALGIPLPAPAPGGRCPPDSAARAR